MNCPLCHASDPRVCEARRLLLDVLDGYATYLTWSAKHRADKRTLIEAGQRERDRAQSIIHHVLAGGAVSWGMFLRDGEPEPQP